MKTLQSDQQHWFSHSPLLLSKAIKKEKEKEKEKFQTVKKSTLYILNPKKGLIQQLHGQK
jgi:hypothetical protein